MHKDGYYSSGEFARMGHVTLRTIRYYDEHHILKPSLVTESGARFYTDADFARLQQILLLKYLGFSLDDIREMTLGEPDLHLMENSLRLQQKLVRDRMEKLQLVEKAIVDTREALAREKTIDWDRMRKLIRLTEVEENLKNQYQNASNISARIQLHQLYSANRTGWFPWLFSLCFPDTSQARPAAENVLEVGCGNGALWQGRADFLPENTHITLSDISEGMLRDARRSLSSGADEALSGEEGDSRFSFRCFPCEYIPFPDESFDLVIANHVLFYCEDIPAALRELKRVLKPGGRLVASTYGRRHMQEISRLVQSFDSRISLSENDLTGRFGRESGVALLEDAFSRVSWHTYEDSLLVTEAEPLILYILSCHGNQNSFLADRYADFRSFVQKKTEPGFFITKDAGAFIAVK